MKPFVQHFCVGALFVALVAGLASGCGKKAEPNVLARVGEQVITVEDFKAEMQRRKAADRRLPDRQALLDEMILRAALVERARTEGLENAADVRRACEDILIAKLKQSDLQPRFDDLKVTPEEISAAYQAEIARFTQPAKMHLAIVFIAADSKMETNRLAEMAARAGTARQLALALPATENGFGRVAADFSDDQISRYRGGDAGWFTGDSLLAERWPKQVINAGLALTNNGDLTDVLKTDEGFYLVRRMDARPAVVTPLAAVQAGIEHRLLAAKRERAEEDFKSSLLTAARVQTNSGLLGTLEYPTQTMAQTAGSAPPALPQSP
jgi:peptidyl-prolyl cis-trans isomerase C